MRKVWDIPGGVHPPENKSQSNQSPIGKINLPHEIILPLNQHIGAEAIPLVAVGEHVLKGQIIADAQGFVSAPVHASTSGTVTAIGQRAIPHASGLTAECIVIDTDKKDEWCQLEPDENYLSQDKNTLVEKIRKAGLAGMGGAGFPTAVKMSPRADHKIHTLILNGTECEPYITADDVLMRERADEIIAGACLFAYLLDNPENIIIGIEDNKPEAISALKKASEKTQVEIVSFPTKYPSGGEKQLIQILTGEEVPSGGIPAQIGVVVQNVGTAVAAYRAARYGEPLISRVTTVVGQSLDQQGNVDVLLGTPIEHVLNEYGFHPQKCGRLIIGGPMMGYAMERTDIPVIKTTNCLLVPSHDELPAQTPAQPCIRCGMCAEACPANLLPQQLFWFSQSEDVDKLRSHNLFDCIECGACSYVCPSNIPLVQYYRASKGMIRHIETDKHKSDRSRQRFEFRQERIAKAEAEKEAKRLARKKAAEEAKKKLAEKSDDKVKPSTDKATSESAQTNTRAKLERAVSSAQSRVERAKKQITQAGEEGADAARIESLEARLKQANQKLDDAQNKLKELDCAPATGETAIKEKISLTPLEKQTKNLETLKKRIATAEEKYAEAQQSDAPTADALKQGVEKLRAKLAEAEKEFEALKNTDTSTPPIEEATQSAADKAIAKAQAKAAAMASMSDEEKAKANVESLTSRLEKAKARLAKAEEENNENIDAFKTGVEKLEAKLQEAKQKITH